MDTSNLQTRPENVTVTSKRFPGEQLEHPLYRRWIRTQECVVCAKLRLFGVRLVFSGLTALGIVECAHVGDRGLGQKCSDLETIALCDFHHRISRDSYHVLGKRFFEHHNMDRAELIARFQQEFYTEAA